MQYNINQAKAQAFGTPFDRTVEDKVLAQNLLQGSIQLYPHPKWYMGQTINWGANPFGEANWVAQLHMLRWLDPLRREAEANQTGAKEFARVWVDTVDSWICDNPPGRGKAAYAWADMVEAVRALTICLGLPMVERYFPERIDNLISSLIQHGEWLSDARHLRTGNHALQQHQGLLVLGAVLNRHDWVSLAIDRATQMLLDVYDDQGVNEEGAVQYHHINFNWWRILKKRIEVLGLQPPGEFDRIDLAPIAMAHATRPDGLYELIGDTEEFRVRGVDHPAVRFVQSNGEDGIPPRERVKIYDAGYIFGRSFWADSSAKFSEADFFSLRYGPQDRIHGHCDGMALTLFSRGGSWLVDSGKYAYDAKDVIRQHLLSREAHNSVYVQEREYNRSAVVELKVVNNGFAEAFFVLEDCGYEGVKIVRRVLVSLDNKIICVLDSYVSESPVTVRQAWHLAPELGHRQENDSVFVAKDGSDGIWLTSLASFNVRVVKGMKYPHQGWFSPKWRAVRPSRVCEVTLGNSSRRGEALTIISYDGPERPHVVNHRKCDDGHFVRFVAAGKDLSLLLGDSVGRLVQGDKTLADMRLMCAQESQCK